MPTIHFNNLYIIQSSIETICGNTLIAVIRRYLLAYAKYRLGDRVLPCIHIKSIVKYIVTTVFSNNINVVRNWLLCLSEWWTAVMSWSAVWLWFIKTKITPNPPVLGANILELLQETPELRELVLPVLFLCSIVSIKSGLDLCLTLPLEKEWFKGLTNNIWG